MCVSHSVVSDSLRPIDCGPPGSSVHGILQARILERDAMPSLQGIFLTQGSNPCLLCLLHGRWSLYHWVTTEAPHQSLFASEEFWQNFHLNLHASQSKPVMNSSTHFLWTSPFPGSWKDLSVLRYKTKTCANKPTKEIIWNHKQNQWIHKESIKWGKRVEEYGTNSIITLNIGCLHAPIKMETGWLRLT